MNPKDLVWTGGVIGAAVSGGIDSMCMLHYLVSAGARVVALTVEHGIRGEESLADVALVEDYCRVLGVPVEVRHVDALGYAQSEHLSVEDAARRLRHAFFGDMLREGRVDCIATAHHLDDNVESVLLNLLRGTGLRGLAGISAREGYIRPFLGYTRADVEAYARANGVPYREDGTNRDVAYRRNYLRHEVLPVVEEGFPHYRDSIARLVDAAAEQVSLLDALAPDPTAEGDVVYLPLDAFDLHPALAKWSVRKAMRHFLWGVDFEAVNLEDVMRLPHLKSNAVVHLAHGVRCSLEYDRLAFWQADEAEAPRYPFGEGRFAFGKRTYVVRPYREGDPLRFDLDKVPRGSLIRLRAEGDSIAKFGGGTKSLGDYYTDKKVPLRVRDSHPVVAHDSQVVVCAADISRTVAVDGDTRRIYTICEED